MTDPTVLLPAFVTGFAVQRIIEIGDALRTKERHKEAVVLIVSVVLGFVVVLTGGEQLLILKRLGITLDWDGIDYGVSALVISAGTEGANSIVKFLSYKKDETAARARTIANPAAGADETKIRLL